MPEDLEMGAVVPVQAVLCPEPHESPAVLDNLADGILRKPVLDVNPVEIQVLGIHGNLYCGQDEQREQKYFYVGYSHCLYVVAGANIYIF